MVALNPPSCEFGLAAPDFDLPDTEGRRFSRDACRGRNGLLVMFICNHCPYVQAIINRLIVDCRELTSQGIGCVAIMSNDVDAYPDDAPARMALWAKALDFPFPYLYDATQSVARAYGAVCTPDFFGYNSELALQYRGRLDASGRTSASPDAPRELVDAMIRIARTGEGPERQMPSIGCSIKWRNQAG